MAFHRHFSGTAAATEAATSKTVARIPRRTRDHVITADDVTPPYGEEYASLPVGPADRARQNPIEMLKSYRWLSRVVRSGLSDREISFLLWVIDHVYGWGRDSYTATYREMRCGNPVSSGTGKSKSALKELVAGLARKGILLAEPAGQHGITMAINFGWKPERMTMCPTPSRLTGKPPHVDGSEGWTGGGPETRHPPAGNPALPPAGFPTPFIEQSPREQSVENNPLRAVRWRERPVTASLTKEVSLPEPKRLSSLAPAPQSPTSAQVDLFAPSAPAPRPVPATAAAVRAQQAKAKRDALRSIAKPGALLKTWQAAFEETFADIPNVVFTPPSLADLGKVKSTVLAKWRGKTEDLHDLVEFTVRNWRGIMERQFGWMTKSPPPTLPSLTFFIQFRLQFIDIWTSRATDRWLDDLPANDQTRLIELTFKQGLSTEVALAKIGEEKALLRMRQENERIRQEALADKRTGLIALQQANRVPVYGVHNPHPQSYAAQKQAEAAAREAHPVKPGAIEEFLAFECPEWDDNK